MKKKFPPPLKTNAMPKGRPSPGRKPQSAPAFATLVKQLTPAPAKPVAKATLQSAPLAHLPYTEELKVKNKALELFWNKHQLPGSPEAIIASPKPRKYRTTSKRRAQLKGTALYLLSGDKTVQKKAFLESPLEPVEHSRIYAFLQKKISESAFKLVAGHLNYLIIRGTYSEQAVIFNVNTMNGPLVRKLKILANHLQNATSSVSSAFIYLDPTGSDYYLEERQPANLLNFKKLFGKSFLSVTHRETKYSFHPTSFSQVNEAMVPIMLDIAKQQLQPDVKQTLLDLYCGYGLFSHNLASEYKSVLGVDAEGPSIRSAMANKKINPGSKNTRFQAQRITEQFIDGLRPGTNHDTVILDPPRKGPADGVISAICRRAPQKIVHIFCGVNQIPESIRQWTLGGYRVTHSIPLDMFPGTANLEVLIFLSPSIQRSSAGSPEN